MGLGKFMIVNKYTMLVVLTYFTILILLLFCGWISTLGSSVRYFYFALGVGVNSVSIEKFEPTWLVFSCIAIAITFAFWMFNRANNLKDGSFVIPERVMTNMSAYFTGGVIGLIWGCILLF
jgi:hypothetical protein